MSVDNAEQKLTSAYVDDGKNVAGFTAFVVTGFEER